MITDLDLGDKVLFNSRTNPCVVRGFAKIGEYVGSIFVQFRVLLDGPQGGTIWIELTGNGRRRVMESVPYGTYANIRRLEVV